MPKSDCHGCEGKGWVALQVTERITPFLSGADRTPSEKVAVVQREFDIRTCLICKGTGHAQNGPIEA